MQAQADLFPEYLKRTAAREVGGRTLAALALCRDAEDQDSALGTHLEISLNADQDVPEWIHLLPAGPDIKGIDGRAWVLPNAQTVLDAFNARSSDLIVDYEHGSELLANHGAPAPASGWVKALDLRADGIWGRVEWTDKALNMIKAREYRYISPGFYFDQETREILAFKSVALVNQPNLNLTALNKPNPKETSDMKFETLAAALGLKKDATEEEILTAINALQSEKDVALNRAANPPADQFVPIATHQLAVNKASELQTQLDERDAADHKAKVDTAINKALNDGKIAPADEAYHRKGCATEDGLTAFNAFVETTPTVVPAGERVTKTVDASATNNAHGLSDAELAMCKQTGTDPKAFAATKANKEETA